MIMERNGEEVSNDSDDDFIDNETQFQIRDRLTTGSETSSGTSRRLRRT